MGDMAGGAFCLASLCAALPTWTPSSNVAVVGRGRVLPLRAIPAFGASSSGLRSTSGSLPMGTGAFLACGRKISVKSGGFVLVLIPGRI